MTRQDIENLLTDKESSLGQQVPLLENLARFGGLIYAKPEWAWIVGPFRELVRARLWSDGLDTWLVKWECRDFARAFACYAQECNALTPGAPKGSDALAVGEFWFIPDASRGLAPAGTGHAINICITEKGVQFIDPQNFTEWIPSLDELASCLFLRF
ncbi:MAG TPA: hypothetical protein VGG34_01495 [Opitutaceae bacterium]|jgi:hypothetical protein